ncbi:MAG: hypothetical protein EON87_08625 [Brevundimonas sp.]|nr:MAG: hypothetical protein EON87_08625 [Brevundimonas sp.]
MGVTTWTAVFTLPSIRDRPEDVAASINSLIGGELQRRLAPLLRSQGWGFASPTPEDHGWHSEAQVSDDSKALIVPLVTCPELDEATPDGGALDDRWRVVIGMDLGLMPGTKARRLMMFRRLAADLDAACRTLGAQDIDWEVGGP